MAIVVAQPSKYCAKEIVGVSHEIHLKFAFQCSLELLLLSRVYGVEYKIINSGTNMDFLAGGLGISVIDDAEEARIVRRWLEVHVLQDVGEYGISMAMTAP